MQETPHKAGFVNIIGNPNVGKSTLMNAFVGERLSIITSKAQTTRHRILGIVNGEDFQVLFSDTPGIIKPAYELQTQMMEFVKSAFDDADILLYMVELGEKELKDEAFFDKIRHAKIPVLLLLNKIDKGNEETLKQAVSLWQGKGPQCRDIRNFCVRKFWGVAGVSADCGIIARISGVLPKGPINRQARTFFCE